MTAKLNPRANNVLIESLESSLQRGGNALSDVPGLLKRVLAEEAWRVFTTRRGELVEHERFAGFVTTPPLRGLGATIDLIRRVVADDPEALDLLDKALTGISGERTDLVSNIHEVTLRPSGTSKARALRKLRTESERGNKQAAELHAEVLAGNKSANAAMIEAGFRQKTVSVPVGRPERVAAYLRKHMPREALSRLVELLTKEDQ